MSRSTATFPFGRVPDVNFVNFFCCVVFFWCVSHSFCSICVDDGRATDPLRLAAPSLSPSPPHTMEPNRIFSAEQIEVHPELPGILKDYSKAVIRANPKDLLAFSAEYFRKTAGIPGGALHRLRRRVGVAFCVRRFT